MNEVTRIIAKGFKSVGTEGIAKEFKGQTIREVENAALNWGATLLTLHGERFIRMSNEWIAI